ncbi:MAG: PAP2 family protein, partial [Paramuribaculum sp.]|nr:PAP2 family protein [Paramuribaculum sp.]
SFPSGHAARAFRGAERLRAVYGWGWGAGGYALAVGVGALRIHHHRHRFGDVAAGAAIGFLSARAAYLLLPFERKIFGWNRSGVTAVAAPSWSPETRSFSLAASITF